MNSRRMVLISIFVMLAGCMIYLHSTLFSLSYNISCNDAFIYIDKARSERLDGNISVTLKDDFHGNAEIVGRLLKDHLFYDVIRSVQFKYRVVSPKKVVIYDVKGTIYANDSVKNIFVPDPLIDFLFFRGKELKEMMAVINVINDTYLFGRENNIVFSCTS